MVVLMPCMKSCDKAKSWYTYLQVKLKRLCSTFWLVLGTCIYVNSANSRFTPRQWETSLQSNAVSPWLGTNPELAWWRHQMKTLSALLALCEGNSQVTGEFPGQWRGALMISLISASINGWVNHREAGDLRSHHALYDVTVMSLV